MELGAWGAGNYILIPFLLELFYFYKIAGVFMSINKYKKELDAFNKDNGNILCLVRRIFDIADKAHDYSHTERVFFNAIDILHDEKGNADIVKLAAILHDVDDYKLTGKQNSNVNALRILKYLNADDKKKNLILSIIDEISFSKTKVATSTEAKIVQDADRLDAIGAIGIARVFTYGGKNDKAIYGENDSNTSVQHFYDKLLKLEDMMNTKTARDIAQERTAYMRNYLNQLFIELRITIPESLTLNK